MRAPVAGRPIRTPSNIGPRSPEFSVLWDLSQAFLVGESLGNQTAFGWRIHRGSPGMTGPVVAQLDPQRDVSGLVNFGLLSRGDGICWSRSDPRPGSSAPTLQIRPGAVP